MKEDRGNKHEQKEGYGSRRRRDKKLALEMEMTGSIIIG
jgi:hypothetical protein